MTFIDELMKNKFFQVVVVLVLFIVGVFVFILAMPAMDDFQVYSLLVIMLSLVVIYYLYQKRKAEYEDEVRAEYEQFIKEHEEKSLKEKIFPTPSEIQQWDQTPAKDQPDQEFWEK